MDEEELAKVTAGIDLADLNEVEKAMQDGVMEGEDDGDESEGTANDTDDGEDDEEEEALKAACPSSFFDGPKWTCTTPTMYKYEDEYCTDGKVDDNLEKPQLIDKYTNIPARLYRLRGPNYLTESETNNKKLKCPSQKAAYTCVGLNAFQAKFDMRPCAERVLGLKKYLQDMEEYDEKNKDTEQGKLLEGDAPKYLVFVWCFSNFFKTEYTSVVHVLRRCMKIDSSETGEDPALDRAMTRFLNASDETKNEKLKYACLLREVNAQLKGAIDMLGGERPVLIGKRLTTTYHKGSNYLEIDMDVGSSNIASMLNGIVLKSSGSFVIDECFCIEGQEEDELPERALFTIRWNRCSVDSANKLDDMGNMIQG